MTERISEASDDPQTLTGIYTETLARLYLRQGFLERALSIYRHLAQEQPDNQPLQARCLTLEQQLQQGGGAETPTGESVGALAEATLPTQARPRPAEVVLAQLERWLAYLHKQQSVGER